MELNEFLEKFLPEYKQKLKIFNDEFVRTYHMQLIPIDISDAFCKKHFPEALQNYTDLICEKQRENCITSEWKVNSSLSTIIKAIGKAEQPKIDEL